MEVSARVILNKIKLVDPATSPYSAYQQSAEIRQLWESIESSITRILTIVSAKFATDVMDASSQIISVLSASTLLSSVIHAIINTQKRLQKSDENIENVIKKEMQVILYHIQILKQDLNQTSIKAKSAQEAIIHHTDILIDSLVAYTLSSSNLQYQIHPYKVSPSSSFLRRHSQPAVIFRTESESENESIRKTLTHNDSSNSLFSTDSSSTSSTTREKTDTVGKKFMRSIHSLKSRPSFPMALLPGRQEQPTVAEFQHDQPPKKKRVYSDHRKPGVTAIIAEEDYPDNSDDGSMLLDDDISTNSSFTTKPSKTINNTLRFMVNGRRHSSTTTNKKSTMTARGIKDLFQSPSREEIGPITPLPKKKRESLSNLFGGNKNKQHHKQSVLKDVDNSIQGSLYSSSTSTSSTSTESMINQTSKLTTSPSFLVSPFAKKTDIEWAMEDEDSSVTDKINLSFETYSIADATKDYHVDPTVKREKSRKRRSNGSLVAAAAGLNPLTAPAIPPKVLSSIPMTRNNSPLPPLPTVENFLTILNAPPTSPDSSYFSARSTSSSSSSTLSSMNLDDVTEGISKAHIDSPVINYTPPNPPPKDQIRLNERHLMDPQDHNLTNINNKQEKRSNISNMRRNSSTSVRINTTDVANDQNAPPKSAEGYQTKKRPPIPPRTSSMPLTPPKSVAPPLPAEAKKIAADYSQRGSAKTLVDESSYVGNKKDDALAKRTKLGRSLGSPAPSLKKIKKSDSGKLLKVTENGNVVLLFEMMDGKLQAIAGTTEKLFERLADETAQDEEYMDTYLMNHSHFISSIALLNLLINRFHLEPSPGEYEYFLKWQFSIQTKVLNVVERWVTFYYYQDFKHDTSLQKRLNSFLYNDSLLLAPKFKEQLDTIRTNLKLKASLFSDRNHHLSLLLSSSTKNQVQNSTNFNFHIPFVNNTPPFPPVHFSNNPRRPSNGLFNLTSPPESPVYTPTSLHDSLTSLDSKDIARYLTLADYYLFKSIQTHGLLNNHCKNSFKDTDYVDLMTKRANMLSHWVVHEICSITYLKPKRALLKKFIEIAKLCLELNNFHTCMVITMGLSSAPKLKEAWESLSNRDNNTFASLQKLLDVSLNMRCYRQKIQMTKTTAIPFLPVVLKDQTFFKENSTFSISHPNLINFSKFRSIYHFIEKNKSYTNEPYWFSQDLTHFPFFATHATDNRSKKVHDGQLDSIGDWIENRLSKVQDCYLQCDLLLYFPRK